MMFIYLVEFFGNVSGVLKHQFFHCLNYYFSFFITLSCATWTSEVNKTTGNFNMLVIVVEKTFVLFLEQHF